MGGNMYQWTEQMRWKLMRKHNEAFSREERREMVSSLYLQGHSYRYIASQLPHPEEGKTWGITTIKRDIDALKSQWRAKAISSIAEHKARQLAEIWEIKRYCWQQKDINNLLKAMKMEIDLLGTNAPQEIVFTWKMEVVELLRAGEITKEQVIIDVGEETAKEIITMAEHGIL